MKYIGWAVLYEGASDAAYFDVLIHRVMEDIVFRGTKFPSIPTAPSIRLRRGSADSFATEACAAQEAFHLVFVHADTGGRAQEANLGARTTAYQDALTQCCDWPAERCVIVTPRHETEAWVLADPEAVCGALGYRGAPEAIGLPATAAEAERLVDPKVAIEQAIGAVRRGRRGSGDASQIFAAVAQRQALDRLRGSDSFRQFEAKLQEGLEHLGAL